MSLKRTPFHQQAKGSMMENEDLWILVTDTDTGERFIEHRWSHMQQWGGKGKQGEETVPLSVFLEGETDPELLAQLMAVAGT